MKIGIALTPILLCCLLACSNESKENTSDADSLGSTQMETTKPPPPVPDSTTTKTYSNARFRNVKVDRIAQDSFRIKGQAQIFEASFGWVVEDGHNELKEGFTTTDAGAPEWGNFDFSIHAKKERDNSTLHIILFETSMKDGSRVYELPIPIQ